MWPVLACKCSEGETGGADGTAPPRRLRRAVKDASRLPARLRQRGERWIWTDLTSADEQCDGGAGRPAPPRCPRRRSGDLRTPDSNCGTMLHDISLGAEALAGQRRWGGAVGTPPRRSRPEWGELDLERHLIAAAPELTLEACSLQPRRRCDPTPCLAPCKPTASGH